MTIRSKTFRALVPVQVGAESYQAGAVVPVTSPHLPRLIEFGFVEEVAATAKTSPQAKTTTKE